MSEEKKVTAAETDVAVKKKPKFSKKKLKHGALAYAMTAIFVVVVVLINLVVSELLSRIPSTIDMTSTNAFSISDETIDYIKKLDTDVYIYVMALENEYTSVSEYANQTNEILKKYTQYSDKIHLEYRDLLTNPDFVANYSQNISSYDIIVETKLKDDKGEDYSRVKVIGLMDTVDFGEYKEYVEYYQSYGYSDEAILYNMASAVVGSNAEQEITSAIMTVTDENPVTVTVATYPGAQESDISSLTSMLAKNGYLLNTINIQTDDIPADTSLLIIPAPKLDYGAEEIRKIDEYLENGGALDKDMLYIASANQPDTPNLDEYLAEYGIEVTDERIVETNQNYYYNHINFTFQFAVSENYKQDIENPSLSLYVPNSLYVKKLWETNGMKLTETFISSSSKAVLCPPDAPENWTAAQATQKGVFDSMVVGTKSVFMDDNSTNYSNIAVLATDYFFDPIILESEQFLNGEFILSFINGLTEKTDTGITIVPKTFSGTTFDIVESEKTMLKWVFALVIPAIVLVIGVVVWVRRRHR